MKPFGILGLFVGIVALVALLNSFFIVDQRQQALVLQVGRAVEAYNEPGTAENEAGLKFKMPFIQSVVTYDKRNLGLDVPDIEVFASNQEQLIVDAFVRWQISEPLSFYQRLGTQREAENQLLRFTDTAIRNALGSQLPEEIISGQRSELMDQIRDNLGNSIAGRGIDIIDVRIKRVDLPPDVSQRVFDRMAATRNQQAEQIRAEGDERAKLVRAEAERERTVLLANARREAEQIRGEGDASRNEIYAEAYQQDAEFFRFQRSLIACEEAFDAGAKEGDETRKQPTRIVVGPDNLGLCDEFIERARANGQARR
ncbi:MAG: protease modulator HflC [Alphaproteobacteria bacterium]|jgi:membrane protease subunit HflC|nr:protease modulator HflC [Alphaproteobacteria bacterium]